MERGYKLTAHQTWEEKLNKAAYKTLLRAEKFAEICALALKIESKTNLLFSFEKMALRDALKEQSGCHAFAQGLYAFLYTTRSDHRAFMEWCEVVAALPRKQTRVLTWPLITVFGFIARPDKHIFLNLWSREPRP